jgi:hypothetical protein
VTDFFGELARVVGEFVRNVIGVGAHLVSTIVHTTNAVVPGGFPVFVVLCVIGVLVGLATLRR